MKNNPARRMRRVGQTVSVALLLLWGLPTTGAAQPACGGHRIYWIGGVPGASFDRTPHDHPTRDFDFDRTPQDHGPPTIPEPEGMDARDRELWDDLVFNAYDHQTPDSEYPNSMIGLSLEERRTLVIDKATVPTIRFCIQSADESYTGERLQSHTDPAWWERNIRRFTNQTWSGTIKIAECIEEPPPGWVYIREGDLDEFEKHDDNVLAFARSWRSGDPHRIGSTWVQSEIVWHPDKVQDESSDWFESTLAHELGHVLGLWHVQSGTGFIMMGESGLRTWPDQERWLAQWAYHVGPNVQYPGLLRADTPDTPAPPAPPPPPPPPPPPVPAGLGGSKVERFMTAYDADLDLYTHTTAYEFRVVGTRAPVEEAQVSLYWNTKRVFLGDAQVQCRNTQNAQWFTWGFVISYDYVATLTTAIPSNVSCRVRLFFINDWRDQYRTSSQTAAVRINVRTTDGLATLTKSAVVAQLSDADRQSLRNRVAAMR